MAARSFITAALLTLALSAAAQAQEADHSTMDHGTMDHTTTEAAAPKGDTGPSSVAFAEANARMHKGMDITYTGKPDVDFVRGMIAHHRGAIDMAKIQLQYGTDESLRTLANGIIAAQEAEIKAMEIWLETNGG